MKIYIASSWRNQHAVEMLTDLLRDAGHQVISFVEKAVNDEGRTEIKFDFVKWINSKDGDEKFIYDYRRGRIFCGQGATGTDLVIYVGPSGTDAWAEIGAAYASGIKILGLWAKGEPAGLMRKMVKWFVDYRDLLMEVRKISEK